MEWNCSSICLVILTVGFLLHCVLNSVLLIKMGFRKNTSSSPDDMYQQKFRELITAFAAGLTMFSIIVSILTLMPRYDYERLDRKTESIETNMNALQEKRMQWDRRFDKMEEIYGQLKREQQYIKSQISNIYNERINPNSNKAISELRKELIRLQGQIVALREEVKKNKTEQEKREIDKAVPAVEIPKIEIPKVNVPEVNVPKVHVPTPVVPKVHVPTPNVPQVHVPTPDVPKVHVPTPN